MTTSRQKRIESEIESGNFSAGTLAYLDWYDFVIELFIEAEKNGLTRAELARRIDKSPAVITRLLSSPSNWTIATLSNLLVGIAGAESVPSARKLALTSASEARGDAWVAALKTRITNQSEVAKAEKARSQNKTQQQESEYGSVWGAA